MTNPLVPGPHWRTEQTIRVPYRVEQYEEQQQQEEIKLPIERPPPHDPYWNRRFWSIQHVHDCIEGKTFHWFWSPMAEVFNLSQIVFMLFPVAVYLKDGGANIGIRGLVLMCLSLRIMTVAARHILEWYHNWRFSRIPFKVVRH